MAETTEKTIAEELREAAARLRGTANGTTPGPWRFHDSYLNTGGHTATVLTERQELNDVELVAWLPSWSHEPWADHPCWPNSHWMALVNPLVAEPLASWLEKTSHVVDSFRLPSHPEHEPCDDPCCYTAHHALAVARVLNGTAPRQEANRG